MSKVRINDLARELEVKPRAIIDILPELLGHIVVPQVDQTDSVGFQQVVQQVTLPQHLLFVHQHAQQGGLVFRVTLEQLEQTLVRRHQIIDLHQVALHQRGAQRPIGAHEQ